MAILEKIKKHLEDKLRPYYYCFGDQFLIREFTDRLADRMFPGGAETRTVSRYDFGASKEEGASLSRVLEDAGTMSMFSETKLIILENVQKLRDEESSALVAFLQDVPDGTCLVLTSPEPPKQDKRKKEPNPFLSLKDIMNVTPDEADIAAWAGAFLASEGKEMDDELLKFLMEESGYNLSFIRNELEKIVLLAGDRKKIEKEDYRKVKGGEKTYTTLDLKDALVKGDRKALFGMFDGVYEDSSPEEILGFIFSTVKAVYQYMFYSARGQKAQFGKRAFFLEREKKLFAKVPYVEVLKVLKEADRRVKKSSRKTAKTHMTVMFDSLFKLMGK